MLDFENYNNNFGYEHAKILGEMQCKSFAEEFAMKFSVIRSDNTYGPNDNFHPKNSHVLPALLRRFHEAKENNETNVEVWGTGKARREFLHVDDLASACVFLLEDVSSSVIYKKNISHLNIGSGEEISIANLAKLIAKIVGYDGRISFQLDKPDGTLRKLMDVSRIKKLGWEPKFSLESGLTQTYNWYKENEAQIRSF